MITSLWLNLQFPGSFRISTVSITIAEPTGQSFKVRWEHYGRCLVVLFRCCWARDEVLGRSPFKALQLGGNHALWVRRMSWSDCPCNFFPSYWVLFLEQAPVFWSLASALWFGALYLFSNQLFLDTFLEGQRRKQDSFKKGLQKLDAASKQAFSSLKCLHYWVIEKNVCFGTSKPVLNLGHAI